MVTLLPVLLSCLELLVHAAQTQTGEDRGLAVVSTRPLVAFLR